MARLALGDRIYRPEEQDRALTDELLAEGLLRSYNATYDGVRWQLKIGPEWYGARGAVAALEVIIERLREDD